MSYLIDTCCVSELVKPKPNSNVIRWFLDHNEINMFLSVISIGELRKGIEKLPSSRKKQKLTLWLNDDLLHRFKDRVIDITLKEVNQWGVILARAEEIGSVLPAIDALIASTAIIHDMAVVTRNTKDMEASGVDLINPWLY